MTAIYLTDFSGITQSRQVVGDCEGTLQLHII